MYRTFAFRPIVPGFLCWLAGSALSLAAQAPSLPKAPGQAAYGALSEVVRLLEADSTTDWSKVNFEALRMHLVDMDEVTLRSRAVSRVVPGGLQIEVTGTGATVAAIQRMVMSHSHALDELPEYTAAARLIPAGVLLTVTAEDPADSARVVRIRGLGFAGLLASGDHHARHHLALARGGASAHIH